MVFLCVDFNPHASSPIFFSFFDMILSLSRHMYLSRTHIADTNAAKVLNERWSSKQIMTGSAMELAQLKRALLVRYKDEMECLTSMSESPSKDGGAEGKGSSAASTAFPSAEGLTLQLLCLREGKSIKDVPATAREQVMLIANAMPTPDVLVEDRLRRAQDESVRLLVQRSAAALTASGDKDVIRNGTAAAGEHSSGERESSENAAAPVTSAERLQLLEKMYAFNVQELADMEKPTLKAAAEQ